MEWFHQNIELVKRKIEKENFADAREILKSHLEAGESVGEELKKLDRLIDEYNQMISAAKDYFDKVSKDKSFDKEKINENVSVIIEKIELQTRYIKDSISELKSKGLKLE